jgi:hypothetical protein
MAIEYRYPKAVAFLSEHLQPDAEK